MIKKPMIYISIFFLLIVNLKSNAIQKTEPELSQIEKSVNKKNAILINGNPLESIIVKEEPTPGERFAAQECQYYLQKATGKSINLIETDSPTMKNAILIGKDFLRQEPEVFKDNNSFGPEPYVIQITQNEVYLAGRGDRGTVYATYDFLEREIGCRWLHPGPKGDFIPNLTHLDLKPTTREEKPTFVFRIGGGFRSEPYVDWATKHRLQILTKATDHKKRGGSVVGTMGHAFYGFLPPEKYFATHPEYYELSSNGIRKSQRGQLCATNPAVFNIIAQGIKEFFKNNPKASYVSLSPNDYWSWCRCPRCKSFDTDKVFKKLRTRDEYSELNVVSDGLWNLLNSVAKKVYPDYPYKKIYCFAYNQYIYPPNKIEPHPMVMPSICHMSPANYARPITDPEDEENSRFRSIVDQWRETGLELFYYAYTCKTMWEQNPWPIARRLARDIKYLSNNNFIGFYSQGCEDSWGQLGVNYYVMAKCLWNPDCNVEVILDDYFQHTYGPASPHMKKYFDTIEGAYTTKGNFIHHLACEESQQILKPEVIEKCDEAIKKAYQVAPNSLIRRRIEQIDIPYRYAKIYRAACDAYARWQETGNPFELNEAISTMESAISLAKKGKSIGTMREPTHVSKYLLGAWKEKLENIKK
jgi:hypothetical protein